MEDDRGPGADDARRTIGDVEPSPDEPEMEPGAAGRAVRGPRAGFDTTGYSVGNAAAETLASEAEVEDAWAQARHDVTDEDLELMDPAERGAAAPPAPPDAPT